VSDGGNIPVLSIIMLAAIYGLQALVFIFRMRWDMIAWMVFYILAIPVFSFWLPLYSFWRMDDFSWGSTRLVVGDKGKKTVIHDEGKFDPKSIPLKSWNDYENELWDAESNHSYGDSYAPFAKDMQGYDGSRTGSMYGGNQGLMDTASAYGRESPFHGSHSAFTHGTAGGAYGRNSPAGSYDGRGGAGSFYGAGGAGTVPPRGTFYDPAPQRGDTAPDGNSLYAPSFYGQPALQPVSSRNLAGVSSDGHGLESAEGGISDAQLEASIRRICDGADLDSLTKKGLRKQLETEYGVGLAHRKDAINKIIEAVLAEY
jgi:chitin synthase